ncbi:MAG: BON domain-containing protein [Acidobacteriota bacterium]
MRKTQFVIGALLVATLAFFSACSQAPSSDDAAITKEIQADLYQDQTLKTRDISVVTQGGTVVLTGQVQTSEEKAAAEQLAKQASGVKKVVNELTIAGAPATRAVTQPPRGKATTEAMAPPPSAPPAARQEATPPSPPEPVSLTVPAGTVVSVQMIDSIDSRTSQPGADFAASLVSPVAVGDKVVFSAGSNARVRLTKAKQAGHIKGASDLQVELASLSRGGKVYPVQSSEAVEKGKSRGKQTAKRVGIGGAVGGLIGGLAGGGKGAAIGAGAGAGAGALTQALTKGPKVQIPSEARLDFSLKAPVTVTLTPK